MTNLIQNISFSYYYNILKEKNLEQHWFIADINATSLAKALFYSDEQIQIVRVLVLSSYLNDGLLERNTSDEFNITIVNEYLNDFNKDYFNLENPKELSRFVVKIQNKFEEKYKNLVLLSEKSGSYFDALIFEYLNKKFTSNSIIECLNTIK